MIINTLTISKLTMAVLAGAASCHGDKIPDWDLLHSDVCQAVLESVEAGHIVSGTPEEFLLSIATILEARGWKSGAYNHDEKHIIFINIHSPGLIAIIASAQEAVKFLRNY